MSTADFKPSGLSRSVPSNSNAASASPSDSRLEPVAGPHSKKGKGTVQPRAGLPLAVERVEPNAPPPAGPAPAAKKAPRTARPPSAEVERAVRELIAAQGQGQNSNSDLIEDLMLTALRLARDGASRGEVKIMAAALREMRYAFKTFRPFASVRKVTVFGSSRTAPAAPEFQQARRFAEEMARRGYMIITGAGPGIMEAAQGGAGRDYSFGVNIRLPFEQAANPVIHGDKKLIQFRYFFTRKLCFVKEASAIALFPGGFGTHDEGFETLTLVQTGKSATIPIVFIDKPGGTYWRSWADYVATQMLGKGLIGEEDMHLFKITDDAQWAADEISQFYSRYHSSRFVKDQFVIRMLTPLPPGELRRLNTRFAAILNPGGAIESCGPFPEEADQAELAGLPRLALPFNRRNYGMLRLLIDAINQA